jgi:hypothetical protein
MLFHIKCSTFVRLASVCGFFESSTDEEIRTKLNTVRLENHKGKTIAIVSNNKVAAIEVVNTSPAGENGYAHVVLDPALIQQCQAESFLDGVLSINTIPEIATAMASTSSGWQYQGNACHWFEDSYLDNWRELAPAASAIMSDGIMMWNLYHLETLLKSSPSGKVYFPQFINAKEPVVLRDRENPHWVGLFVPKPHEDEIKIPAVLPEWWRA